MELLKEQQNWDELGKDDPLWVVLTDPDKKGGKWDPAEFFATGKGEIESLLQEISALGQSIHFGKALDFGCGVGRLTQALAAYFDEVHGVDISPSMIGHANRFNPYGPKCVFHVNSQSNLQIFPSNSFDFVYSNIALQHIEPKYSTQYIAEFMRLLKPGGMCAFQVGGAPFLRRLFPEFIAGRYRRLRSRDKAHISMFAIPERRIIDIVEKAGGIIVQLKRHKSASFSERWRWMSLQFVIVKSRAS